MSYDLVFWRQVGSCPAKPSDVYRELSDGTSVDGLATIQPHDLVERVEEVFPGTQKLGGQIFWEGGSRGMFELVASDQHIHFCCRQMNGDEMNKIIDLAAEFDLRLYDPQIDKQFG